MDEKENLINIIWDNFQDVPPPLSYVRTKYESSKLIESDLKGKINNLLSAEDSANICFDVDEMTDEALLYYIPRVMELILQGEVASVDFLIRSLTNETEPRLKQAKQHHIQTFILFLEYCIAKLDFDTDPDPNLYLLNWKKRLAMC